MNALKMIVCRRNLLLLVLPVLLFPTRGWSWGKWQHEVIAEIAEENLTASARKEVKRILGADKRLSDVAIWADVVRPYRPLTAPWHYVNYPLKLDEPDYDVMNTPEGNVVSAIENEIAVLENPGLDDVTREEALKFLVHFVGDLHQPLHCGMAEDRGANLVPVTWHQRVTNLHLAWDILLFRGDDRSPQTWAWYLQADLRPGERAAIARGRPYDWMVESHRLAREFCYPHLPAAPTLSGRGELPELSGDYERAARPVIRRRLLEAGLRLAMILNGVLGEDESSERSNEAAYPSGAAVP